MSEEKNEYQAEGSAAMPDGIGTESRVVPSGASADLSARITALEAAISEKDIAWPKLKRRWHPRLPILPNLKPRMKQPSLPIKKLARSFIFCMEASTSAMVLPVISSARKAGWN